MLERILDISKVYKT